MSDTQLVVLSLWSEDSARDLVRQLDAIDKLDQNVTIVDAAMVAKNRRGKPKLTQLKAAGSTQGGLAGAVSGAFSGLASLFRDAGLDDDMMRRTGEDLAAGEVALFILYQGDWQRSSAVLQDALAAHGIQYRSGGGQSPAPATDRPSPASSGFPPQYAEAQEAGQAAPPPYADAWEDAPMEDAAAPADAVPAYAEPAYAEPEFYAEPPLEEEPLFEAETQFEADPEFDAEPTAEPGDELFAEPEDRELADELAASAALIERDVAEHWNVAAPLDAVAEAARAAMIAAAMQGAADAHAEDARAEAEETKALSEATAAAGALDMAQGEERLDASAEVGEAGARVGLLALERKYSGMEVSRIAGELAEISREVGDQAMPLIAAFLAHRSGDLQRIGAEMVASAASARELAQTLDAAGARIGELGAAELDEGVARLAAASVLAAHAADLGASEMGTQIKSD